MRKCAHCGRVARGHASTSFAGPVLYLCHGGDGPDCYRRVTVYHELVGRLRGIADDQLPEGIKKINGAENNYTDILEELLELREMIERGEITSPATPSAIFAAARERDLLRAKDRLAEEDQASRLRGRRSGHSS